METLLNNGTLDDFRELVATRGIQQVAVIFRSAKGRQKGNYDPATYNFFDIVFERYAPSGNTQ